MKFPKMAEIKQSFPGVPIPDMKQAVAEQFKQSWLTDQIKPGMRIAVTAGSRGIANIALIIRTVCEELKVLGATPFIVPAMGSHGGATAVGQTEVLKSLGITQEFCGAPILSSMDVVQIGKTNDVPVWLDKQAWGADGIILVNRVKPHTDFHSPYGFESGLMKMAAVGLGKQKQAEQIHSHGVPGLRDLLPKVAQVVLEEAKVLCGLAIVENAQGETVLIEVISSEKIMEREPILLKQAFKFMPRLPIDEIDVLIVDEIGKDFSGTGMDTNVIGRRGILGEAEPATPNIKYVIASELTDASHGNALGVGLADFTTRRLFGKINFQIMNENANTSTFLKRGMIPLVLENTRACLKAALACNWGVAPKKARVVRIPNTLDLKYIQVSEILLPEIRAVAGVEVLGKAEDLQFDQGGYLVPWGCE